MTLTKSFKFATVLACFSLTSHLLATKTPRIYPAKANAANILTLCDNMQLSISDGLTQSKIKTNFISLANACGNKSITNKSNLAKIRCSFLKSNKTKACTKAINIACNRPLTTPSSVFCSKSPT